MRVPGDTPSAGQTTSLMAELVDLFPTLAEIAGVPLDPSEVRRIDGTSLAPVFEDPSLTVLPNNKGTFDKRVAYSQFPHRSDFGCACALVNSLECARVTWPSIHAV